MLCGVVVVVVAVVLYHWFPVREERPRRVCPGACSTL